MNLRSKFARELANLGLPLGPTDERSLAPVTAADLAPLPATARRYLEFMRVLGRPRDWSFRLGLRGRFRLRERWVRCDAWQYDTRLGIARIFYMRLRLLGVPVLGRDTYAGGRGRMRIRPLDLVTVGDGAGEAYDVGELVTYLNDCVALAPSMLLVPEVRWCEVDDGSFEVALTDHGRTVRARVLVDDRGAPVDFETTDRFRADAGDPSKTERCRWTTPLEGYRDVGARRLPLRGRAIWHPEGEAAHAYAEFDFDASALAFNVAPGA